MRKYILNRLLASIPLLVGISILLFALLQMLPGGPLSVGEGRAATSASSQQMERLRANYGFDAPIYEQYLRWGVGILRGDWGTSFNTGKPVTEMIAERIPATLMLTGSALILSLLLSFPLGIIAAVRQHSVFDYILTTFATFGIATPSFWLGIMMIYLFAFTFDWLPSSGLSDPRQRYEGFAATLDTFRHLIMPVSVLTLIATAQFTRYVRSSMLEVLNQDYLRTARAKGLTERRVVIRHALRNGIIPVITVIALEIPNLFLGAVVTESVFAIPGMGRLFIESADLRDYPMLMGILIIAAVLVVVANLLADLMYGIVDPRIRYT